MEIELKFTPKSEIKVVKTHYSRAPWEKEVGLISFEAIERTIARPSARKDFIGDEPTSKKFLLKKWEKF